MTIKQQDQVGCAIACLAMATGKTYGQARRIVARYWSVYYGVTEYNGLSFIDERVILFSIGYRLFNLRNMTPKTIKKLVGNKQAILEMPSLNEKGLFHAVYWDGKKIHDPSGLKRYTCKTAWNKVLAAGVVTKINNRLNYRINGLDYNI